MTGLPMPDSLLHDPHDVRTCREKVQFRNKQKAKEAAARLKRQVGRGSVYECVVCGHFHITKADQANVRYFRREALAERAEVPPSTLTHRPLAKVAQVARQVAAPTPSPPAPAVEVVLMPEDEVLLWLLADHGHVDFPEAA